MTAKAVRRQTAGKLLVMFGADGSRDTTKRPAMGLAAARNSDIAIITDHHPRYENPQTIRDHLYLGSAQAPPAGGLYNITPPEDAVTKAVSLVGDGDAILWFGPGHQDHREINGVRYPYDPRGLSCEGENRDRSPQTRPRSTRRRSVPIGVWGPAGGDSGRSLTRLPGRLLCVDHARFRRRCEGSRRRRG